MIAPTKIREQINAEPVSRRAILIAFVLLIGCLYFSFSHNEKCLMLGLDGTWYRLLFPQEALDRVAFAQTGVDALSGSFDAYYPLQREYLLPSAIAALFTDALPSKGFIYFVYATFLLLSIYGLGRAVGVERPIAMLAGFSMAIFAPPGIVDHLSLFY